LIAELRRADFVGADALKAAGEKATAAADRARQARELAERAAVEAREAGAEHARARDAAERRRAELEEQIRQAVSQADRAAVEDLGRDIKDALQAVRMRDFSRNTITAQDRQALQEKATRLAGAERDLADLLLKEDVTAAVLALRKDVGLLGG
jgi:hypothetical protein